MKNKANYHIILIVLFGLFMACTNDKSTKTAEDSGVKTEMKKETDPENQKKIENSDRPAANAVHAPMPPAEGECSENLLLFEKKVNSLLDLGKKRNTGDKSEETLSELKEMDAELREIGEKIEKGGEHSSSVNCIKIWMQSSTKYANFVHENWSTFN